MKTDMIKNFTVAVLLFISASGTVCHPDEAVVITAIKSRNIIPHDAALKGFENCLTSERIDARIMEYSMEGKGEDDLLKLREEIKTKKPSLVLTLGTPATKFAQGMIKDIPVVFTMVLNPEKSKITPPGVSMSISPEIKLNSLKRISPYAKKIGLIHSLDSNLAYEEVSRACNQLDFQLIRKKISSKVEFPDALKDISQQIDCFLIIPDSKIYFPRSVEYLLVETLRKKIPVIGPSLPYTKAGALISFDCDYEDLGKQAGEIAIRILAGEKPVNVKFTTPRKISFSLNLMVAERLGIKIPSEMIKEAKEIF